MAGAGLGQMDPGHSLRQRHNRRYFVAHHNPHGLAGSRALSARERQVIAMVVRACSNKEIAYDLKLAMGSVSSYIASAMRSWGWTSGWCCWRWRPGWGWSRGAGACLQDDGPGRHEEHEETEHPVPALWEGRCGFPAGEPPLHPAERLGREPRGCPGHALSEVRGVGSQRGSRSSIGRSRPRSRASSTAFTWT